MYSRDLLESTDILAGATLGALAALPDNGLDQAFPADDPAVEEKLAHQKPAAGKRAGVEEIGRGGSSRLP